MSEQRQSANIGDTTTMQKIEYWKYTFENNGTSRSLPLKLYSDLYTEYTFFMKQHTVNLHTGTMELTVAFH